MIFPRFLISNRFLIEGRVQGVGYRAYVQQLAWNHGCVGEVWNLLSGEVAGIVQGDVNQTETFLVEVGMGPGWVRRSTWEEEQVSQEFERFEIGVTR